MAAEEAGANGAAATDMETAPHEDGAQPDGDNSELHAAAEKKVAEMLAERAKHNGEANGCGGGGIVVAPAAASDRNELMAVAAKRDHSQYVEADIDVWMRVFVSGSFHVARNAKGDNCPLGYMNCCALSCAGDDGGQLAVFGEYYVLEDERDRGVGTALWRHAGGTADACGNKTVAVLQSSAGRGKLRDRCDFAHATERPVHRLHVQLAQAADGQCDDCGGGDDTATAPVTILDGAQAEQEQLQALADYDQQLCKIQRKVWLDEWIRHPCGKSAIALDASNNVTGYAVVRTCAAQVGGPLHVGPLYADSEATASQLLKHLLSQYEPGEHAELILHVVSGSNGSQLAQSVGTIERTVVYMQMFTHSVHQCDYERVYAISDLVVNVV